MAGDSGKAARDTLRALLSERGCDHQTIAAEFRSRWGYTTLAAYRYAFGLTQTEVAARYNRAADDPRAAADASLVSKLELWPGVGGKAPTIYNLVLLGEVYGVAAHTLVSEADLDQLPARDRVAIRAMHAGTAGPTGDRPAVGLNPVERSDAFRQATGSTGQLPEMRPLLRLLPDLPLGPLPESLLAGIDRLRIGTEDVLTAGTVTPARMDQIEEAVSQLRWDHTRHSPSVMLAALLGEFTSVIGFSQHRQTARIGTRLSGAAAQIATLTADTLMKLGETADSHAWYRTARLAADDTPDLALRAQVRAQEAMLPYYYGDLHRTIRLAQEAQRIAGGLACAASCLAAAAEARAWARLGHRTASEAAIARAEQIFSQLPGADGADAFAFPEKRLLLYLSGALTYLGEPSRAARVQDRALALYSGEGDAFTLDPTLIRLDQAAGLAASDAESACELTQHTLRAVPAGHRTKIVLTRGSDVLAALPDAARRLPVAGQLREVLALTASSP